MYLPSIDSSAAMSVLDRVKLGVIVADAIGRILGANAAASSYLRDRDGLGAEDQVLRAEMAHETEVLHDHIRAACQGRRGAILLDRSRRSRRLQVAIAPFNDGRDTTPKALVTIYEPGRRSGGLIEQVKILFGLTPAEAEIAADIALGVDIGRIAATRRVSANTLRAQLASAMAKMGIHRQAEFGAAILGLDVID